MPNRILATLVITLACLLGPGTEPSQALSANVSTRESDIRTCNMPGDDVWLSFDDGGSPKQVKRILRVLRKHNVRAMFFPTGQWATAHPSLMNLIANEGHLVGNHTYSHPKLTGLSNKAVRRQIAKGPAVSSAPKLLRPPYGDGAFDNRIQSVAQSMDYQICFWTVDTRDWSGSSAKTIIKRVKRGQQGVTQAVRANGVVLMHMQGKHTGQALPGIIKAVRGKGLTMPKLSE